MITINNQQYKTADLSEQAKAHLAHLRFIDAEIQRCQMSVNVFNISRQRIGELLQKALPKAVNPVAPAPLPVAVAAPVPAPVPTPVRTPVPASAPVPAAKPKATKRKG